MKNKEQIMNTYAKEQGYESWDYFISDQPIYKREEHYFIIIDLVQDELKKKVESEIKALNNLAEIIPELDYFRIENLILNTENL